MSASPSFTSVPRFGAGSVTVANTNRDGTGTLVDVITGVAAGTKISEIIVKATGDPADSIVTIFYFDGTTNWLIDEFDIGDPAAASTTVAGYRESRSYANLILVGATHKIKAAITVALTAGAVNVVALGGDLT